MKISNQEKEFRCDHLEAETIMFYMYSKLRKLNNFAAITNADNADMRDLAAKVTDEIPCVQGIYEKKVIFD